MTYTPTHPQVLFEDEQVLPDGRSRRRNVAVSEKMVCGEPWLAALHRAVKEELSSALPPNYQVGREAVAGIGMNQPLDSKEFASEIPH